MIPGFTPTSVFTAFRDPLDEPYTALAHINLGGLGLNDPSLGLEYQRWTTAYTGTAIEVRPEIGVDLFTITRPGVTSVSGAFDANMAPTLGYMDAGGARCYFFNSLLGAFDTLTIATATSCQVCMDDSRTFAVQAGITDVIFAYVRAGNLYYRQQRDRYTVEYLIGTSDGKELLRCGQTIDYRCAFKLGPQP